MWLQYSWKDNVYTYTEIGKNTQWLKSCQMTQKISEGNRIVDKGVLMEEVEI